MHPNSQLKKAVEKGFDPKVLYSSDLTHINESIRKILKNYSNIPDDQILQHVKGLVSIFTSPILTVIFAIGANI